jgi:hypothetical protein
LSRGYLKAEETIRKALKQDDFVPHTTTEKLLIQATPQINKTVLRLNQKHKEKIENRVVALAYILFLILISLVVFNYIFTGINELLKYIFICGGVLSLLLVCCIPLLIVFKENIGQRRNN